MTSIIYAAITLRDCVSEPIIDTDDDGVPDNEDNCIEAINTSQLDTDQDGYGNRCDLDFNNDNVVNFLDISLWIPSFNNVDFDPDHDIDGSGSVNHIGYVVLTYQYLGQPGPSGLMPSIQSDPNTAMRNSRNR